MYPPPDLPARVVDFMEDRWNVAKNKDGHFTITEQRGGYKIVERRENDIFVSQKTDPPLAVAVENVGGNQFTISVANQDRLFTYHPDNFPPITLELAHGAETQRWTFIPADRDL
ncbi:hypothetical protein BGW39_009871 [Mortierella sp. 14UC]|nr:hypothetical protein BGW39_009871 [Mortierella sp. 14UC]